MKIKTSELSGVALNWAVAHCEELKLSRLSGGEFLLSNGDFWFPSTNWAQGGPIIEREGIALGQTGDGWEATCDGAVYISGQTPLIAAMRCYVMNTLNEEVEIPEEVSA